jgi:hypothetical protein
MQLLKFSRGNAKLDKNTATFSLPAGHSCPGAMDCLSKADRTTGKITDGAHTQFRCFAASQEASFTSVRESRWRNYTLLQEAKTRAKMRDLILASVPKQVEYVRIHISGDFFNMTYLDAWLDVARALPEQVFYAYTKSLHLWKDRLEELPSNFRLTASRGGRFDEKITELGLTEAVVIFHPDEAMGRKIDHDDSLARSEHRESFALLIHGTQPKGSKAASALKRLKAENIKFSYSKMNNPPTPTFSERDQLELNRFRKNITTRNAEGIDRGEPVGSATHDDSHRFIPF